MPILYFDIESTAKQDKILKVGFVWGEEKGTGRETFNQCLGKANYVVGHNILSHDIPLLQRQWGANFSHVLPIDTLFWSVLLRPERETHKLDKDYQFSTLSHPNPVADSLLARHLLVELQKIWFGLNPAEKNHYRQLLQHKPEGKGFLTLVGEIGPHTSQVSAPEALTYSANSLLQDRACQNSDWERLAFHYPVETGLASALILHDKPELITPSWMSSTYPAVEKVLTQLRATACADAECKWCTQTLDPISALRKHFSYPAFRRFEGDTDQPLQQQAVEAALRNESLLTIFPTGGGKSLTFQLPALIRGEAYGALTVVISPLVSLMKDQVDGLNNRNILRAVTLNSILNPLERKEVIDRVQGGQVWLLYLSPEMLRSTTIYRLLKRRRIDRFVVDEAHCFSAWGQDFRPDYAYIGKYIAKLQRDKLLSSPIPVSCFTATARREVVDEIHEYFQETLQLPLVDYATTEARKNLSYGLQKARTSDEKFERLLGQLQNRPGPAIVFVALVKRTRELCDRLKTHGIHALPYYGKMDPEEKKKIQDEFLSNDCDIIIATSAFGMGVDKDNVQLVIHYDISPSLEAYMQEAGRAGRDPELQAKCAILYDENDLNEHFVMIQNNRITQKEINLLWRAVKEYKRNHIVVSARELARQAGWDEETTEIETQIKAGLSALERVEYIERELNSSRVMATSLQPKTFEDAQKILKEKTHLLGGKLEEAHRLVQALYGKDSVDVDDAQEYLNIKKDQIAELVDQLRDMGILADEEDIVVKAEFGRGEKAAPKVLEKFLALETEMVETLGNSLEEGQQTLRISLKEWNDQLLACENEIRIPMMRRIIEDWFYTRHIDKSKLESDLELIQVTLKATFEDFRKWIELRQTIAKKIVEILPSYPQGGMGQQDNLPFSILGIKRKIETGDLLLEPQPVVLYHQSLLFLHRIKAIEILKGFIVFANRMRIARKLSDNKKQYSQTEYRELEGHYLQKIERVHIVGEFARRLSIFSLDALKYAKDYFTLPYEEFLAHYFPGRKRTEIRRALTSAKYDQIFKDLTQEQKKIINDTKTGRIMVSAGPGSGKTRVLVHKMASLLLIEDMKPQQFLMLAFSRPAVQEFKDRLRALVGGLANYIEIRTFHGFAFSLLGKTGSLEKSDEVIPAAIKAIREETAPMERIKSRSVLMLDEFQDISQKEFDLIQAIMEKAEDIKVIAAGDDDQSIYGFRGGSVEFMKKLVQGEKTETYYLTENFRARPKLVAFSNAFLQQFRGERMKADQILKANRREASEIKLVKYAGKEILVPFAESITAPLKDQTAAVLTGTNEEALLVATLLREKGLPIQFIASRDDFNLANLFELRTFQSQLFSFSDKETGEISPDAWRKVVEDARLSFSQNADWPLIHRILDQYDKTTSGKNHSIKSRHSWREFCQTLRMEDFFPPEEGKIFVSTMHKAKGKEFNHVHLLLDAYSVTKEEDRRVVYVAITRAKDSLKVHTHLPIFDAIQEIPIISIDGKGAGEQPRLIVLSAPINGVVLSHFEEEDRQQKIQDLHAGMALEFSKGNEYHFANLIKGNRRTVAVFSKGFSAVLTWWLDRGYQVVEMKVAHVVLWRDIKNPDAKEVRVVLPEIKLERILK